MQLTVRALCFTWTETRYAKCWVDGAGLRDRDDKVEAPALRLTPKRSRRMVACGRPGARGP
jgi:hypothetical protein